MDGLPGTRRHQRTVRLSPPRVRRVMRTLGIVAMLCLGMLALALTVASGSQARPYQRSLTNVAFAAHSGWLALPADTTTPTTPSATTTVTAATSAASPSAATPVASSGDNSNFIAGIILIITGALLFLLIVVGSAAYLVVQRRRLATSDVNVSPRSARRSGRAARYDDNYPDDADDYDDASASGHRHYDAYGDDGFPGAYDQPARGSHRPSRRDSAPSRRDSAPPRRERDGAPPRRERDDAPSRRERDEYEPRGRRSPPSSRSRTTTPADWSDRDDSRYDRPRHGSSSSSRGSSSSSRGRRPERDAYPPDDDDPRGYR